MAPQPTDLSMLIAVACKQCKTTYFSLTLYSIKHYVNVQLKGDRSNNTFYNCNPESLQSFSIMYRFQNHNYSKQNWILVWHDTA